MLDQPELTRFPVSWLTQYGPEEIRVLTLLQDLQALDAGGATDQELADRLGLTRNGVNRIILRLEDRDLDWSGLVRSTSTERGSYAGKYREVRPVPEDTDLITVPMRARDQLRGLHFMLYGALSQWDSTGEAVTIAQISAACATIPHTARRTIGQLVDAGWVTQTRTPHGRGMFFYVLHDDGQPDVTSQAGQGGASPVRRGAAEGRRAE